MLHTIVDFNDVFCTAAQANFSLSNSVRSSNPYDYVRRGYYLDNGLLFGGQNNVNYNCFISGNRTGSGVASSNQ